VKRREFIAALGGAAAWPAVARAQQGERKKRIVVLSAFADSDTDGQAQLQVFRDGLSELGWIEDRNVHIETLWRAGSSERASAFVSGLVQNPPDIVIAGTLQVFLAMRRDASTIPMVFTNLPDPVAMGFVKNLAKPDGSFTGFTAYEFSTAGKWLEVLKELAPRVSRVAMTLANASQPVGENFYRAMQGAGRSLGVETTAIRVNSVSDVEVGISAFAGQANGGLVMAADAGLGQRALVIELAARYRFPAIYPLRQIIEEGGLAFYGIDFRDLYRGVAIYVDRILRGARPAALPIQAPTKFQLVINMQVAKALGLDIPPSHGPMKRSKFASIAV
jgi:putative tryptophan/tyrosine transport system substrate-binding protein